MTKPVAGFDEGLGVAGKTVSHGRYLLHPPCEIGELRCVQTPSKTSMASS